MTFTVIVRAGDCPCPGTPHTEERIEMIDALTLPIASAALVQMRDAEGELGAQEAAIVTALLPACIESWSFVEANPDGPGTIPVPVSRENMERLIPWSRGGFEIAEEADSRYGADPDAPFDPTDAEVLAGWADGILDLTEPAVIRAAPGAIGAILARDFGWQSVRGPGPVTWREALLTLQLRAEERIGFVVRERARMLKAIEDARFADITGKTQD